jgi:hypothetical protein
LAALDSYGIRYLVVGGIAVGYHAEPRYTKHLDLLVCVHAPDHRRLYDCLAEFGAPVSIMDPEQLLQEDFVFHFGVPPWRIDILRSIPGVDFDAAYRDRVPLSLGDYEASCISREWLIKSKKASGRPQDLLDLVSLESPLNDGSVD